MSRILCVDTSSFICSVSVFENLSLISSHSSEVERSHSKLIIQLIDQSLKDAKIKINEVDAFAVSMGPGSYTGLRIGVSTIKGLCYSLEKPLISIMKKKTRNNIKNNFQLKQGLKRFLSHSTLDELFVYLKRKNIKIIK